MAAGGMKPFNALELPKHLDGRQGCLRERRIRHPRKADVVRKGLLAENGVACDLPPKRGRG